MRFVKRNMFSEVYYGEIRQYFAGRMELLKNRAEELRQKEAGLPDADKELWRFSHGLLEQKIREIDEILAGCAKDEREALQFLYSAMPLSDLLNYPAEVYLAYARHGVFLWQEGPFAGKVPEKIFANYVLHHRVHNEDIADTRKFFYEKLKDRTAGKSMYDAAVETNFWCAQKATYQSTFSRTQNPLTMYGTAIGRCGEEAPFASTALRSIGIPAREVAAPWWAHCDDNHAWVEAWCDGKWHFLGGCEPEDQLDKGWFQGPAARAMIVDSTWFGKDKPLDPVSGRPDMTTAVNHMRLYADTLEIKVKVADEMGNPAPGARVDFMLLNYAKFNNVASLTTGSDPEGEDYGAVRLDTGYGDLLVSAYSGGLYGEKHICLGEMPRKGTADIQSAGIANPRTFTVVIKNGMENLDQWREMDFHAPREIVADERKTEEQFAAEKAKLESAAASRQKRVADFYRTEAAERILAHYSGEDREALEEILHQARGNMGEIVRFLEWDFGRETAELERLYGKEGWKLEALKTLEENDYWDISAEILAECSRCAAPYASGFPREVFFRWLLCPVAMFEKATVCRELLLEALGEEQKEKIRQNPAYLPGVAERLVVSLPDQEYANLITSPAACLTGGIGSEMSRAVLCIQIYRALGIPARMKPVDRSIEYYSEGNFVSVVSGDGESGGKEGTLILKSGDSLKLDDWKHYSLSRFEKGRFMPLFLWHGKQKKSAGASENPEKKEHEELELDLAEGIYRLVTTNRLPNGNQFVRIYDFRLEEGQKKQIEFSMRDIPVEAILDRRPVRDMALYTEEGEETALSVLGGKGRSLFLWLELAKEPTEHILNEMCEKQEAFGQLEASIYFVVRKGSDYQSDGTLKKAWEALPLAKVLQEDFGEAYGELSYQAGRNPGKLPLVMVMENGKECVYSDAGYNVGMADPLLRILSAMQNENLFCAKQYGNRNGWD